MSAESILCCARELGIRLELVGDKVRCYAGSVPPDFVDQLRRHKADVMEYLRHRQSHCQVCLCDGFAFDVDVTCSVCGGHVCVNCGGCLRASYLWRHVEGETLGSEYLR